MEAWTIGKLLGWTTDYYQKNKIESSRLEAEILLAHTLGLKRIEIYSQFDQTVKPEKLALFKERIQRRLKREPLAYIINSQPFMSLDFYVDRNVLIPRPETELLVEKVIEIIKSDPSHPIPQNPYQIADLGTGSGCIAVSLAKFLPNVTVVGIDNSPAAIEIAKKNAEHHGVANRCDFIVGDMFDPELTTKAQRHEGFNLIVSNPPYIPTAELDKLQPEVRDWEPRQALDGGLDGLDCLRRLINESSNRLTTQQPNYLLFEFGFGQAETINKIADGIFQERNIIKDLNGLDRIFIGRV